MKSKYLLLLAAGALLASCGGNNPTPSDSSLPEASSGETSRPSSSGEGSKDASSDSSTPAAEKYAIQVSAPSGIEYELSATRAAKGEEVVLTITHIPSAFTITSVTLNNVTTLEGHDGIYSFTMPGRSVTLKISVDVRGEVVLVGDVPASLTLEEGGVYAARGIKVSGSDKAYFSYQVSQGGETVTLDSTDLDEYRCFANVTFAYGSAYELVVAPGYTYDFFYDPASEYPCYVRRTSVDFLPANASGLESLFDGMMRSESTVNYPDLKGIRYSVRNREDSENPIYVNSDFKVYENNVTFLKAEDTLNEDTYYAYKNYDEENKSLTLVDTYTPAMGNNDRTRIEANHYGAASAHYDVLDSDFAPLARSQTSARDAKWQVGHTAHYAKQLEEEIQYAYRTGYAADELTSSKIDISSVKQGEDIVTTIDSYAEYNASSGTYTSEIHEAHVFKVSLTFDGTGRVKSLDFTKTRYGKEEWSFTNHKPNPGYTGVKTKTITAAYDYGAPYAGAPEFDVAPYFIDSIEDIRFYNPETTMPEDGNSYLHYLDTVSLNKTSENDKLKNLAAFDYLPETALDVWQYGPVASSDHSIFTRRPNDLSFTMTAVGVGTATVTFGNYTEKDGTHFDEPIQVVATQKFHSIYLYSTWGGMPGDCPTSDSGIVTAGEADNSFYVQVTPSNAPVIYEAQSSDESLLKVVDAEGNPGTGKVACGEKLTLDATGAKGITTNKTVTLTLTSDWFQPGMGPKTFTFTIVPAAADVKGTNWNSQEWGDDVVINFTTEAYSGTGYDYVGYIHDYGETSTTGTQVHVTFAYKYEKGQIRSRVTAISFVNDKEGWSTSAGDYAMDFYYEAATDRVGLFLAEVEFDSYYEDYVYYCLFGDIDDGGDIASYTPFVRALA